LGLIRAARACSAAVEASALGTGLFAETALVLRRMAKGQKRFACIYAAPPWPGVGRGNDDSHAAFSVISEGLARLPLGNVVARHAHLHLATIPDALPEALEVLNAWGFRFASSLILTKMPSGSGDYWPQAHEIILLGVCGRFSFQQTRLAERGDGGSQRAFKRRGTIRRHLELVSPGPYLDLFGSVPRRGWVRAAHSRRGRRAIPVAEEKPKLASGDAVSAKVTTKAPRQPSAARARLRA